MNILTSFLPDIFSARDEGLLGTKQDLKRYEETIDRVIGVGEVYTTPQTGEITTRGRRVYPDGDDLLIVNEESISQRGATIDLELNGLPQLDPSLSFNGKGETLLVGAGRGTATANLIRREVVQPENIRCVDIDREITQPHLDLGVPKDHIYIENIVNFYNKQKYQDIQVDRVIGLFANPETAIYTAIAMARNHPMFAENSFAYFTLLDYPEGTENLQYPREVDIVRNSIAELNLEVEIETKQLGVSNNGQAAVFGCLIKPKPI